MVDKIKRSSLVFHSPKGLDTFTKKTAMKREPKRETVSVDKEKYDTMIKMFEKMGDPAFWNYWLKHQGDDKPWVIAQDMVRWINKK